MNRRVLTLLLAGVVAGGAPVFAQDPPPAGQRGARQPPVMRGGPQNPVRPQNIQNVQDALDGWALVESERVLQLSEDQSPNFIARYLRLQRLRRQLNQERNRLMRELQPLVQGPGPHRDQAITDKLREIDEAQQRAAAAIRQAWMDVDAVLTPVQRGRLRNLEERLETRKLDLLMSIRAGRGKAPAPAPGGGADRN